jgi:hypothetical protein
MVRKTTRRERIYSTEDGSGELIEVISSSSHELKIRSSDSSFEVESTRQIVHLPLDERPRLVRFSLDHSFFPVISRRDIPKEYKKKLWYRGSELKRMRIPNGEMKENEGSSDSNSKDSFFECQRALHKLMAISSVLDEQERQKKEKHVDPVLISRKYQEFVSRSKSSLFISQLARSENNSKVKERSVEETRLSAIH